MYKKQALILVSALFFCTGCPDEMVGAPCVPETDNGVFSTEISGVSWSIETRSVQCATSVCLTQARLNNYINSEDKKECQEDPTLETCWDQAQGVAQLKYSFCSCRCRDVDGNTFGDNPDKYDYLCECPGGLQCEDVLDPIDESTNKISGGYCIPNCINEPCADATQVCTPSKNSEEPWKWFCADAPDPIVR